MTSGSKIFQGYRALGFVSDHVPLTVRYHQRHKENYVITCVGKAFHTYNCSRLGIVSISDSQPDNITCLAVNNQFVFTACQNIIQAYTKGKQVKHTYEGHESDVHLLLPFGNHLISVDVDSQVKVWDIESEGIYLEMGFSNDTFQITTVMHPSTYLNKILLGSKQGIIQLWNILRDKMLYSFQGWNSPVTVIEQSPAVHVVAVGLADGQIILHNIKFDETVVKFRQDWGPVTAVSFRTDGHPILVTGSAAGHIALWNLEERKLQSQIRNAHSTAVSGMKCLPSEPLMVSSAADNSLKVWIFDLPDGGGRVLRQRAGHSAPPNRLQHYGKNGKNILSAGQDSTLMSFSTEHDKHNKSLGRASFDKAKTKKSGLRKDQYMMPPITHFSTESARESDWDNIIACHRGLDTVTTWSYQRSTMGKYKLKHPRFEQTDTTLRNAVAKTADVSSCGNFTVIGYSSGHVDMYNMQSGIFRGSYGDPSAHSCSVEGVAIDGLNQKTVTAGRDGEIKFWRFKKKEKLDELKLQSYVSQILLHRDSSMLAVCLDDFNIKIIDLDTHHVVRDFTGHSNRVTDMTFSADGRWLITSSMDCTIRTWDMPTARLVDCFLIDSAATCVSMSPTGDFLATAHVDNLGVYLWSNRMLFTHVPIKALPPDYEPVVMEMPTTKKKSSDPDGTEEREDEEIDDYLSSEFKSPEQISDELVTLSLLPNSRWQNLMNLDEIKMRNKPKQPPKVPKAAPFFLPTVAGLEPKFNVEKNNDVDSKKSQTHLWTGKFTPVSDIGKLLSEESIAHDKILKKMKDLGPSSIDIEIRSLGPENGGSEELMSNFLQFIDYILCTNKDFELINSYLALFLKVHGEMIASSPKLLNELNSLQHDQNKTWKTLQDLFCQNLCLVNYMRTATL